MSLELLWWNLYIKLKQQSTSSFSPPNNSVAWVWKQPASKLPRVHLLFKMLEACKKRFGNSEDGSSELTNPQEWPYQYPITFPLLVLLISSLSSASQMSKSEASFNSLSLSPSVRVTPASHLLPISAVSFLCITLIHWACYRFLHWPEENKIQVALISLGLKSLNSSKDKEHDLTCLIDAENRDAQEEVNAQEKMFAERVFG